MTSPPHDTTPVGQKLTNDAPAPDLYYAYGDGYFDLAEAVARIDRLVMRLYHHLIPREARDVTGCIWCGVGPDDECSMDCRSRHTPPLES